MSVYYFGFGIKELLISDNLSQWYFLKFCSEKTDTQSIICLKFYYAINAKIIQWFQGISSSTSKNLYTHKSNFICFLKSNIYHLQNGFISNIYIENSF